MFVFIHLFWRVLRLAARGFVRKSTFSCISVFQMYNFTSFAMALNELDKEMESVIPKTDCRLRPDIRAMENGEIGTFLFLFKTEGLEGKKKKKETNSIFQLLDELLE